MESARPRWITPVASDGIRLKDWATDTLTVDTLHKQSAEVGIILIHWFCQ